MQALKIALAILSGIAFASCATKNVEPTDKPRFAQEEMRDYYACMADSADLFSQSTSATPSEILIASRAECRIVLNAFKSRIQKNFPDQPDLTEKMTGMLQSRTDEMVVLRVVKARSKNPVDPK